MPKKGGPNQKAVAAADKKAAAQSVKDAKAEAQREKELAAEWAKGSNNRGKARADEAAAKADEAARKKREKEALLAEEEAAMGSAGKPKKTPALSKGKKKGGNDLSLLENALVSGAEKKMKAKKQAEREKAEQEKQEQAKRKEEEKPMDPLLANTEDMIRGTTDDLVGRAANKALDEENAVSGIDGALETLNISAGGPAAAPSAKALYKSFEERLMPEMKKDYPGLKLSQYKDKIFQQWKKSPENPANQLKA
ncbi:coiled-coil domain containing protein [Nitzschia inconspicua]|uniref:Coiled-coil domain containing protein n=1 Tax=Nitzschia inconspicua TaxID=303405 RepID=A0A9K3L2G2_9STRA|nr:coiled-coil domain containing protein [Nitzschia inconspicua]